MANNKVQFKAGGLILQLKPGDKLSIVTHPNYQNIVYNAAIDNREQFLSQGREGWTAKIDYKTYLRLLTHCTTTKRVDTKTQTIIHTVKNLKGSP